LDIFDKFNEQLNRVFIWVAGTALIAVMALAVVNMFLRAFYVPFGATWELIGFFAAITTALALGYAQINKVHVAIDILVQIFPARLRFFLESITFLLSLFLFSMSAWHLYLYAGRVQERNILAETLRIPYYPLIYLVAAGFLSFALVLLADFIKSVIGAIKGDGSNKK
jgi:TRAP-type C4-dicarboxylate transport system permease small subunit